MEFVIKVDKLEKLKITTIGEALIDWVCMDRTLDLCQAEKFIKAPGGAPANVAVALAKLNYPVQFIGGFSEDIFGQWLKEFLSSHNVDTENSITVKDSNTRNAYILTDKTGNRVLKGFSMSCCADSMVDFNDINLEPITSSPLVYFGSLLQASEQSRFTLNNIINAVVSENFVVYDPNLRLCLWESKKEAINIIKETFSLVDSVKLSDDEIELITEDNNVERSAERIFKDYNLKLLVVTLGNKGSFYINKVGKGFVNPFKVESVEMTGAGDAFVAALLGGIYDIYTQNAEITNDLDNLIESLPQNDMNRILIKANAMGALTTTKPGATSALPTMKELDLFLNAKNSL